MSGESIPAVDARISNALAEISRGFSNELQA